MASKGFKCLGFNTPYILEGDEHSDTNREFSHTYESMPSKFDEALAQRPT